MLTGAVVLAEWTLSAIIYSGDVPINRRRKIPTEGGGVSESALGGNCDLVIVGGWRALGIVVLGGRA